MSTAKAAGPYLQPQSSTYPRAFVFRQSEVLANLLSYAEWEDRLKPLGGLVGKLLPEERTDTVGANNIPYFRAFKERFPNKMCMLHFNAVARLPEFETANWYPGWWLCKAAVTTARNTSMAAGQMEVADLSGIELETDAFGGTWQDLLVTRRSASGQPDFTKFEYVRLTGIDPATRRLTIERGLHGSRVRYWPAGSFVAPIVSMGPFYRGGNRLWYYNFASNGPRNAFGATAADAVVSGIDAHLKGDLAFLDGIQLDVFNLPFAIRNSIDGDGDGVADAARDGGRDTYLVGLSDLLAKLRFALGEDRLLITDGGTLQRPNLGFVNGVELEGTPTASDPDFELWSQGLETLNFYRASATKRAFNFGQFGLLESSNTFSYNMYKTNPPLAGEQRFANFRMALATSLLASSAVTYFYDPIDPGSTRGLPPGEDSGQFDTGFTIWDELLGGAMRRPGWLGYPLTAPIHVIDPTTDHYNARGILLTEEFVADIEHDAYGVDASAGTGSDGREYLSLQKRSGFGAVKFDLPAVVARSGELTLNFQFWADPLVENPETTPRFLTVSIRQPSTATRKQTIPVGADWQNIHLYFRDLAAEATSIQFSCERAEGVFIRSIRAFDAPDLVTREFSNGAVFANPSARTAQFDVAALFPGQDFRRLVATDGQDSSVNSGDAISDILEIPPIDALVVRKA